jgi:hypothetical protein
MPKNKILIQFSSIHLLWQFAQRIGATNIEINMRYKTLLCDCSAEDLELLPLYKGTVIQHENKDAV